MTFTLPRTEARPCGCDQDTGVFGHTYCVTQAWPYGKHLTCQCSTCTCSCHKDG